MHRLGIPYHASSDVGQVFAMKHIKVCGSPYPIGKIAIRLSRSGVKALPYPTLLPLLTFLKRNCHTKAAYSKQLWFFELPGLTL